MAKFKIDYDIDADDLFLYSENNSKGSVEIGNIVLDYDNNRKLVGIEFLNATQFLRNSVDGSVKDIITKSFLSNLIECEIQTKHQNNFLFIKVILIGKHTKISCPINAPLVEQTSPALAYA